MKKKILSINVYGHKIEKNMYVYTIHNVCFGLGSININKQIKKNITILQFDKTAKQNSKGRHSFNKHIFTIFNVKRLGRKS